MKDNQKNKRTPHSVNEDRIADQYRYLAGAFPLLWIGIIAFLLFGQTIRLDYTYLDDQTLVLEQMQHLRSPEAIMQAWKEDAFHAGAGKGYYYRPVLTISFIADTLAGHGHFPVYHVSNILYHILAAWLLFLFLVQAGVNRKLSFMASLLFVVHPLTTQAVAWVPGRNDSLLAVFTLGSFICWMKYLADRRMVFLLLHLLLLVLAFFTKENALLLPGLMLLYSLLFKKLKPGKYLVPVTLWVILATAYLVVRKVVLYGPGKVPMTDQLYSIIGNLPAILPFLGKALFPFQLSVFPAFADMTLSLFLGILAIAVIGVLVFMTRPKEWRWWAFSLAWFLAFLVPALIKINKQIPDFAEHRMYLPMAGLLMLLLHCKPISQANFRRPVPVIGYLLVVILFGTLTFLHSRNFRNRLTFWQCAVSTSPSNAFNYNNLGAMYYLDGDRQQAEIFFRKALDINPFEPMANSNTGLVCMNTQRPAEAEKYLLREIEINPAYAHAYYNLGLLYAQHARYEEAVTWWEKTLTISPDYPDAYRMLVVTYRNMNRPADAARTRDRAQVAGVNIP